MSGFVPSDQDTRDRLTSDLDRTFYVQAGAGTGKTTTLVARIVKLVEAGRLDPRRLVAITFTEAAASELRDRVRQALGKAARDADGSVVRERCAQAAREIDLAAIQTIHAFAGTLLRMFPIEAGLPPGFEVWDEIQAELAFDERFRGWLFDEISAVRPGGAARVDALRRCLLLGMKLDDVRALAERLHGHLDRLEGSTAWAADDPPDALALAREHGPAILGLRPLLRLARNGEADPLVGEIRRLEDPARRLAAARDSAEALLALRDLQGMKHRLSAQKDWENDPATSKNPLPAMQATLKAAREAVEDALARHRRAALVALLLQLHDFTRDFAAFRRRHGAATFEDLLVWCRDLLRDNSEVRGRARDCFDRIFVDEFQDTDPLQAEIVRYLASDPCEATDDWRDLPLQPGKLFLVGDPKQSIYRFRRADIALYQALFDRAAPDERANLTQNFRSTAPVVTWVNDHFQRQMRHQPGAQPDYVPIQPIPGPADVAGGVYVVGDAIDGSAGAIRDREAVAIAAVIRAAIDGGWSVRGRDGEARPARYADIAVLLRGRTNLQSLEDAFQRRDIPYRIEGGSLVLQTQEVHDLLAALRAIDDPSDQVALVAALRSPAYACSDVDLLAWVEGGGRLDYLQPGAGPHGPVAAALASLTGFHHERTERSVAATIEAFLRERALAIGALGQPRSREAWRRLRYVVAQSRRLDAAGRSSLRALVDWLERQQRAGFRDLESPATEPDEDAARMLTIHHSKGLEFPIVILTDLGAKLQRNRPSLETLVDPATGRIEARCGAFETAGYAPAKKRGEDLDLAETQRLLYVAATRARDHLVLSLYRFPKENDCHAARLAETLSRPDAPACQRIDTETEDPRIGEALGNDGDQASPDDLSPALAANLAGDRPSTFDPSEDERRWHVDRADRVARLKSAPVVLGEDAPAEALGRAVLLALGWIGLGGAEQVAAAVDRAARAREVEARAPEVARLVKLVASPALCRAVALGRVWTDVAIGAEVEGAIIQGRIALLYEQPDGALALLQLDRRPGDPTGGETALATERARLGLDLLAVEAATRRQVASATLLSPETGAVSSFEDLERLRMEARVAITLRRS